MAKWDTRVITQFFSAILVNLILSRRSSTAVDLETANLSPLATTQNTDDLVPYVLYLPLLSCLSDSARTRLESGTTLYIGPGLVYPSYLYLS